jgi:bacteriocin-like protein
MSKQPKEDRNQSHKNIDEIIDAAVDNAEARQELSEDELNEVDGGIKFPIIIGLEKQDSEV